MDQLFDLPERLETLDAFRVRTGFVYEPQFCPGFTVSRGVGAKVAADGTLLPYAGNTVVLMLPEAVNQSILAIQRIAYDRAGWCLSQPLPADSFHITLHDLESGVPSSELEGRVEAVQECARELSERIAASGERIRLRSTKVYCMAATSLVLGFEPADEESCRRLMAIYALFERIRPLGYPLTPHVTLGYLRPGRYTDGQLAALRDAVETCRGMDGISFETSLAAQYTRFSDMATYWRA